MRAPATCVLVLALPLAAAAAPAKPSPKAAFEAALAAFTKEPSDAHRAALFTAARAAKPALPEEAERRMARGEAAFLSAKEPAEMLKAAAEFAAACDAAPWAAGPYFNLGLAQEKAGRPADAMASFKRYLLAAPDAKDAAEVRKRVYKLEFAAEEGARKAAEESAEKRFTGAWNRSVRGGHGGMVAQQLLVTRDPGGSFGFKVTSGGATDGYQWNVRETRMDAAELSFYQDEVISGIGLCGTYAVRGSVSPDGRTLTLRYSLQPFPPHRPLPCPLAEYYGDHSEVWTR